LSEQDQLPEGIDEEIDEEVALILSGLRRLRTVIEHADWFHHLGQPLGGITTGIAEDYVNMLGFPGTWVAAVPDWEHAAIAAENPEINSDSWEAEEQLRVHLTSEATVIFGEQELHDALEAITTTAGPVIFDAAANAAGMWGVSDDALVEACAGAALQACYNAALVIIAEEEETHPCALKFALFEAGHWPIGIAGQSLNIF
jgi:hypothetical protein